MNSPANAPIPWRGLGAKYIFLEKGLIDVFFKNK